MRALCWHGRGDVRVDTVPDPKIQHPRDAIVRITACAICGSDLHLLDGYQPTMESGDILGHENMGEVIELGREVTNLKIGDRVVVPFTISCGQCWFCQKGLFSACDRTNSEVAIKAMGHSPAGLFGFSPAVGAALVGACHQFVVDVGLGEIDRLGTTLPRHLKAFRHLVDGNDATRAHHERRANGELADRAATPYGHGVTRP